MSRKNEGGLAVAEENGQHTEPRPELGAALRDEIAKPKKGGRGVRNVTITAPKMEVADITIVGTSPLVMNRFSQKAMEQMKAKQEAGSVGKKGVKRDAKDFQLCYEQAKHVSREGWCGIPAPAFRNAAISACKIVGFAMTRAKLSLFIEPDGFDRVDGTPLVKITKGEPEYVEHAVRNESGVADIRPRPMWQPGWEARVRVRYDAEQFSASDVYNLFARVGIQVGILEGRPDSKSSAGLGWGLFGVQPGETAIETAGEQAE